MIDRWTILSSLSPTARSNRHFDYESNASTYTITVQAKDDENATVSHRFTVLLLDDDTDPMPMVKKM